MLLIFEALLILAALGQDHRAAVEGQTFPLDMAPNSVDDQYEGCTNEMSDRVENYYLAKEISASAELNEAWQEAQSEETSSSGCEHLLFLIFCTRCCSRKQQPRKNLTRKEDFLRSSPLIIAPEVLKNNTIKRQNVTASVLH
ncbi:hypothetical protein Q8A67_001229 [Cirrhinus molitorella]|uniref:NAD(P)(+)--arginine ADP-ribosyltransferase n=1 Tax=Cirrhinus molitorella TaxID=172907 RepID=A0AA88U0W6_9TELE|nr:hypothetical protein Q8A67_001229 [Cirrhinus molitorella]